MIYVSKERENVSIPFLFLPEFLFPSFLHFEWNREREREREKMRERKRQGGREEKREKIFTRRG